MHVFVTGGAGFIGSNLITRLLALEHRVTAIDNFSAGAPARERAQSFRQKGVLIQDHDVRNVKQLFYGLANKPDAIVHLAAPISVQESMRNPHKYRDEITVATGHILNCAKEQGIKRVVIASTAAVYGDPARVPVSETDQMSFLSPYAKEKFAAERLAGMYAEQHCLETASLRFFNVYGPGQDPNSTYSGVVAKFMERVRNVQPPVIFGDGTQTRDLVYVGDVVDAVMQAINKQVTPGLIANIGSGSAVTINDLVRTIIRLSGNKLEPQYAPPRDGDIKHSQADITRARRELGYEPRVTLEEGLRDTWEWFAAERKY